MFMHRQSKKAFRLGSLFSPAVVVVAAFLVPAVHATTTSYTGTGSTTFTVPANVTSIQVTLTGAAGGVGGGDGSNQGGSGGPAGRVTGTLAVTPGDTLTFSRGGSGGNGTSDASNGGGGAGGSNAGGRVASGKGGDAGASGSSGGGGGGGGSAFISRSGVTLAEAGGAGGGGGAGNTSPNQAGLSGNSNASYNGLSYVGGAGTSRGAGNDGGGGGGGGTGKRGGAGGGLRTAGDTDSGGNGGSAGENDTSGLTSASSSYITVAAGANASISITYTAVPSAPVISGTSTDTSVALSWSAPASGPAITDYLVQYRLLGASTWATFNDGVRSVTGATVTGLNHSSSYEFQVAAVNGDGTGAYSTAITVATKKNFYLELSGGSPSFTLLGPAVTVDSSLTITDEMSGSITAAKVQISSGFQTGDTLALPTGGAAAAFPGITGSYNPTNGILTLSGSGTASVYQAALRAVTFTTTNTSTAARSVDVTLGNAIAYNGHFYEVVTNSVTWPNARSGASAKSLFGIPGYLVNITSADENQFILSKVSTTAWIGASDSGAEGTWKWMDGPEAGTTFWIGTGTGSAQGGQYANWNVNEPNDSGGNEDYASIYSGVGVQDGKWNDFGGSGPYIVEYGNPSAVISFSGSKTLSINLAPQTISFSPLLDKIYGDAAFTLNATGGASGNPITYSSSNPGVATVSGNTVTIVGAGTTTITANQAGNSSYAAAPGVSQALTVNKKDQSIGFGPIGPMNYGDAPLALPANTAGGLPVSYTSSNPNVATVSGNTVTIVGVGTTEITASQAGDANHHPAVDEFQNLTVQPVLSSVDGATVSLNFQVADTTSPLSYANGWSSNDQTFRPDGYADDSLNAGNTLGYVGGFVNAPANATTQLTYNFTPGNSNRYVFQWNQSVNSSSSSFPGDDIFGWRFLSGANTAFSIRFLNDSSTGRDLLVQGYDGAGNALTLGSGQPNNWFIDRNDANDFRVTADLENKKWALDVFNKANSTWFGLVANADIDPSLTSLNGIAATWTVSDNTFDATAGQYFGAGDNIMTFDNLTIQGKQTVVIDLNLPASNPTYNGLSQAISPTTSPPGVAVVVKYNGSTNEPINAGTYTVTAEVADTTTYYSAPTSGSLTVEKATLTAVADNTNRNYGEPNPSFIILYTGFENGEDEGVLDSLPTASSVADTSSPVGPYDITLSGGSDNNYNFNFDVGQLYVDPIPATGLFSITLPANLVYDGTAKECEISTSGPTSFLITYDDGVNIPTVIPPVNAGIYTVTATVADTNYNTDFVTETMVIAKATQTITFPGLANGTVGGSLTLTATSNSGLDITYSSSDTSVATVTGTTLNYVGVGLVTITASQAGNNNYEPASDESQTFSVASADTPWDIWADSYSMANGTERTKTADPDGDGFNNATEFAFGQNPKVPNAAVFTATKSGANYVVTFKKRKLVSDATYDFRSRTALTQAFSAGAAMTPGAATSVDTHYEQVSVTLPIAGTRGFIQGQANVLVNPSR